MGGSSDTLTRINEAKHCTLQTEGISFVDTKGVRDLFTEGAAPREEAVPKNTKMATKAKVWFNSKLP